MNTYFYSNLITLEPVVLRLSELSLTADEKKELLNISEENLHYILMDLVLTELSDDDKKIFFLHLTVEKHEPLWEFLHSKIDQVEDKIKKAADDFIASLNKDILESHRKEKKGL
jgi:hypothetical protein